MAMFDSIPDWLPEDPAKKAAAKMGLMQFGAALMGGRGNLGQILGGGLQAGMGGYQNSLAQQQQQALMDAQQKHYSLNNKLLQGQIDEPMQLARIAATVGGASSLPQLGSAPQVSAPAAPSGGLTPLSNLPQMSQPGDMPVKQTAPQADPMVTSGPKPGSYEYYLQLAQAYATAGKPSAAQIAMKLANDLKPKLKEQQTRVVDGKRVVANVYEDGRTEQVQGFAPDMGKLNFQNTGGATVALDPYTGKPVNTIQNTQSPDSVASVAEQRRNNNMVDARSKDSNENARGVIIETDQGPMLANSRTGTTKQIIGPDGKPVERTKPLNDGQSKALLFGTRMQEADKILAKLAAEGTTTSVPGSHAPLIGGVVDAFSSDNRQMLNQAKRDFINATLRRESGAAISTGEFSNGESQYFPQVGDGEKVKAQKARNRALAISGVLAEVPEKQRGSITPVSELPQKPKPQAAGPQPGAVQGGYRFKGGNPADKSNWEKA